MEQEKNKNGIITLLTIIIVILLVSCILLVIGTINFKSNETGNNKSNKNTNAYDETNNGSSATVCLAETYDGLEISSIENAVEKIPMVGGPKKGYNVTTTVTKEHNYTSEPESDELYANDMAGTLYVLYKNKLYYTSQEKTILKYCSSTGKFSWQRTCDYLKINDDAIKEFNTININLNLKAIGTYGNSGSGSPIPYAITDDGKVINLPNASSHNYSDCGILYDNAEHPIDRIFNLYLYDGVEYTILLKEGILITRDVDREHPIDIEY